MSDFHFYHFFLRLQGIYTSSYRLLGKVYWCIFVQLSYHAVGHLCLNLWCYLMLRLLWVPLCIWPVLGLVGWDNVLFAKLARFFGNKSFFMPIVLISNLLMSAFGNESKKCLWWKNCWCHHFVMKRKVGF